MQQQTKGVVEMTIAMLASGTIGWFVLRSGQSVPDVVFWRSLFGALTLGAICTAMGLFRGHLTWRVLLLSGLGGLALVTNWLLLFGAYSRSSISIATAIYNTQPFMLVGLGALLLGEKVTANKLGWMVVAFAGMLLIVDARVEGDQYLVGVAMSLGAAFFYAVAAIATKKLAGTPPHLVALIQVIVASIVMLPHAASVPLPEGAHAWAMLGAIGVVHTGLVYILLYGAIQKLPTLLTGSLSYIYPTVAFLVDRTAFGTQLQPVQLLGVAAILLGAAGTTLGWSWPRRKPVTSRV